MAKIVPIGLFAANRDKNLQKRGIKPTILAIHISGNADGRQICPFLRVKNNNFVYCGGNPVRGASVIFRCSTQSANSKKR
jgi:hypothetical protein